MGKKSKKKKPAYCVKDINQDNDSKVYVIQKNYCILYFDGSCRGIPDLKDLGKVLSEELNFEIDEEGNVMLNTEEIDVKELEGGGKAFILEEEEVNMK